MIPQNKIFINNYIDDLAKDNDFAEFNALDYITKFDILDYIISSQSRALRFCIDTGEKFRLNGVGTFELKDSTLYVQQKKQELVEKYGSDNFNKLSNDDKIKVRNELALFLQTESKQYRKEQKELKKEVPEIVTKVDALEKFIKNSKKSFKNT